jgi:hypothetical protein
MAGKPWENYQAQATTPPPAGKPWEKFANPSDPAQPSVAAIGDPGAAPPQGQGAQAALEGVGDGASAKHLPALQALTEPIFNRGHDIAARISNAIAGTNEPTDFSTGEGDYAKRKSDWDAHQANLKKTNPGAYAAGQAAGGVAMSFAPGAALKTAGLTIPVAASIPGRAAMAMTGAAGLGALENPGNRDVDKDGNPTEGVLQLSKRIENAKKFAGIGGLVPTIADTAAPALKSFAETQAFKSLGPYARAAVNAIKRGPKTTEEEALVNNIPGQNIGGIRDVGRAALDNGIITPVPTGFSGLASRSQNAKQAAGVTYGDTLDQLGEAEKRLMAKASAANGGAPVTMGVDRKAIADQLRQELIKEAHGDVPAVAAANKRYNELINQFEQGGESHIPVVETELKKQATAANVNYAKNPADMSADELFNKSLATKLKSGVEDTANVLSKTAEGPSADNFIKAKNDYGNLSTAQEIASKRFSHELAKTITSSSLGGIAGGASGFASGGSIEDRIKRAIVGGGAGLIGGAAIRKASLYGPQALAFYGDKASNLLPEVSKLSPWLAPAAITPLTGDK